jgi:hypothetical protein
MATILAMTWQRGWHWPCTKGYSRLGKYWQWPRGKVSSVADPTDFFGIKFGFGSTVVFRFGPRKIFRNHSDSLQFCDSKVFFLFQVLICESSQKFLIRNVSDPDPYIRNQIRIQKKTLQIHWIHISGATWFVLTTATFTAIDNFLQVWSKFHGVGLGVHPLLFIIPHRVLWGFIFA